MKVKKKFTYNGMTLQIVEREETYLNSPDPVIMTRVIAPNGGVIPVSIKHKQTLKSIAECTIDTLEGFKKRGADVVKIMTEPLKTD